MILTTDRQAKASFYVFCVVCDTFIHARQRQRSIFDPSSFWEISSSPPYFYLLVSNSGLLLSFYYQSTCSILTSMTWAEEQCMPWEYLDIIWAIRSNSLLGNQLSRCLLPQGEVSHFGTLHKQESKQLNLRFVCFKG